MNSRAIFFLFFIFNFSLSYAMEAKNSIQEIINPKNEEVLKDSFKDYAWQKPQANKEIKDFEPVQSQLDLEGIIKALKKSKKKRKEASESAPYYVKGKLFYCHYCKNKFSSPSLRHLHENGCIYKWVRSHQ